MMSLQNRSDERARAEGKGAGSASVWGESAVAEAIGANDLRERIPYI